MPLIGFGQFGAETMMSFHGMENTVMHSLRKPLLPTLFGLSKVGPVLAKKACMKTLRLGALCLILSATAPLSAMAQMVPLGPPDPAPGVDESQLTNVTPELWFVELASPPTADGGDPATLASERAAFVSQAQAAGLNYTVRHTYQSLFHGFSVKIAPSDIGKLSRIPGVQRIYPVGKVDLNQAQPTDTPDQQDWLARTGADYLQNQLGLSGKGMRVAVIDTGVDYTHPDLGGCFGPGCRVTMGYDLVGDAYDGTNDPVPDRDPMDCEGHGTHVSGIIGANGHGQAGHVTGVAPQVTLHMYRVFGCTGPTTVDNIVAALEMALSDGADIVSMSIGGAYEDWAEAPAAMASDRLVRKGIVVVAAAGNNGAAGGTYATGAPSTGKKVISVASYDNLVMASFTVSPDNQAIGYVPGAGGGPGSTPPTSGTFVMAKTGTTTTANDACNAPIGDFTGKVVLIRRGTCSFDTKALNAQQAGAAGVVFYNTTAGLSAPPINSHIVIPVVMISATDGATLNTRIAAGPTSMTWTNQLIPLPTLVSTFSSFGPTAELDFKPDVGAPGGSILSTWPVSKGSYATLGGTSMATPNVAGSVALLLQARPHTPPALVRDLLQNNAVPANWNGNPALGVLDNVHVQGAGLIHIDRTVLNDVSVSPGKLALGDSAANAAGFSTQTLTFTNSGGSAVTYDLSHVAALTTGATEFMVTAGNEFSAPASVIFSAATVTVPAGGSATVNVTITPPMTSSLFTYGGYVLASRRNGGLPLRVPYMGTVDYQAVNVLGMRANGFPRLTHPDSFAPVTNGAVFNLSAGDLPTIRYQLDHPTRTLSAEILSAPTTPGGPLGKDRHLAFKLEYLARNSSSKDIFAIAFDGTTSNGDLNYTLPPGNYVLLLTALQPLGDPTNPRSVETWQSPVFTIVR